jgi:hypothetical protein
MVSQQASTTAQANVVIIIIITACTAILDRCSGADSMDEGSPCYAAAGQLWIMLITQQAEHTEIM